MNNKTGLEFVISLEFKKIFPQMEKPDMKDLFRDIPTNAIMEIMGHFNSMIYGKEMDLTIQKQILDVWLSRLSNNTINKVNAERQRIVQLGGKLIFFNNQTSLLFIENALSNFSPGLTRNLTPEEEERLFIAYLSASQDWITQQEIAFSKIDLNNPKEIAKFGLPVLMPFDDLKKSRDFRWQVHKALEFFTYCEQHEELKTYLSIFTAHYQVTSWKDYIYHIINSIFQLFKAGNRSILITRPTDAINSILDQLSLDTSSYKSKIDFISLREKPVYKQDNGRYLIYNFTLFIDKIFQTIQFDFANILKANGIVKDIPDFKTRFVSKPFYEQYLLYNTIKYIHGKRKKMISLDGGQWEQATGEEGPDFYIRCGTKIFLIEFKDSIFQAAAKVSFDFDIIKKELYKKLKENEKGKQKGVTQLANWINTIASKELPFDTFEKSSVKIYPILVLTDEAFNNFGVNFIMRDAFEGLLSNEAKRITESLIIVHIDTLLELQDVLRDRQVPAQQCLDWFNEFVTHPKSQFDPFISFSQFISSELKRKDIKYNVFPRKAKKMLPQLFEKKND